MSERVQATVTFSDQIVGIVCRGGVVRIVFGAETLPRGPARETAEIAMTVTGAIDLRNKLEGALMELAKQEMGGNAPKN